MVPALDLYKYGNAQSRMSTYPKSLPDVWERNEVRWSLLVTWQQYTQFHRGRQFGPYFCTVILVDVEYVAHRGLSLVSVGHINHISNPTYSG